MPWFSGCILGLDFMQLETGGDNPFEVGRLSALEGKHGERFWSFNQTARHGGFPLGLKNGCCFPLFSAPYRYHHATQSRVMKQATA